MDILGIGPLELIIVFVIILLILGPNDMTKVGRTIGEFYRKLATSDGWHGLRKISREIKTLPNRLAREAQLEKFKEQMDFDQELKSIEAELKQETEFNYGAWTQKPSTKKRPPEPDSSVDEPESQES